MFTGITINLENPICSCNTENLRWGINFNSGSGSGLNIECDSCGTKLTIPHSKFIAGFSIKNPYPSGPSKEKGKIIKLVKDDK